MSFATRDLILAIVHHLLVFTLAGVLAIEFGSIQENMTAKDVRRIASVDIWYGVLAAAIIAVGFARAIFAAKGWAYYSVNFFFWAKIATFAAVGLLSIQPTIALLGWKRALATDSAALPDAPAIRAVRGFLWAEVVLFVFIPAFAAAMARGYGE